MFRRSPVAPIDVLVVCTGNVCRSPIIATLISAAHPDLIVRSAGTGADSGRPWHPYALRVLAERGHAASGSARQLRATEVRAARLVLTAEGAHRAEVVRLDPAAEERTFTLLEASRLIALSPVELAGVDGVVPLLAQRLRAQRREHDDDLADPVGGDIEMFRACRATVDEALSVIAPTLGG